MLYNVRTIDVTITFRLLCLFAFSDDFQLLLFLLFQLSVQNFVLESHFNFASKAFSLRYTLDMQIQANWAKQPSNN